MARLLALDETARKNEVVAASAGNHAQGVAFLAKSLGINAKIVMPLETPVIKILRTEKWGATVVLDGADLTASEKRAT